MSLQPQRNAIRHALMLNEPDALKRFESWTPSDTTRQSISNSATQLIEQVRASRQNNLMESMLAEYGLSTEEGVALMCLAEAMLRVPDSETMDALIEDKVADANWASHRGQSPSSFINASTWGLMLTGKLLSDQDSSGVMKHVRSLIKRMSEPVIRTVVGEMLKRLGSQFVLGQTIDEAMKIAAKQEAKGYTYSYDMLGEGAKTFADAERYERSYRDTILAITPFCTHAKVADNPGISVKLSALYPRYEFAQHDEVMRVMVPKVIELARLAAQANMGFNIDAEEVDRLDLSLDIIQAILADESLENWQGLGVVVQAYGKRAPEVLDWLYALATQLDRHIMVRLVKGAYWDAEIKRVQVQGLSAFPVYTQKVHTDIAYLSCAQKLLTMTDRIYPQFATHNAHSISAILKFVSDQSSPVDYEFQRLHGMGEALHDVVLQQYKTHCRIYAPVGPHQNLLAYLVRRLLENGANGSFVHQLADERIPAHTVATDPWDRLSQTQSLANAHIRSAEHLFEPQRANSHGIDITDPLALVQLANQRDPVKAQLFGQVGVGQAIINPSDLSDTVGWVLQADTETIQSAIARAHAAQPAWARTPVSERATCINRFADLMEAHAPQLYGILAREAGKTLADAVAEVREAVDFCRYYAAQSHHYAQASPRGVISCISPWNFPLAIFSGQIVAALVTGNAVLAKPAEQTPIIAQYAVDLMHQAGVPQDVVQLLCGDGSTVGAALTADSRIAGVCFTGSGVTAKRIQTSMVAHLAADAMLIAETGGLNAMMVDSSALPEQVVRDVIASAFQSAGQRCSALRVLYVQEDVAEGVVEMIQGAMDTLHIGNPWDLSTDVGPVIDAQAQAELMGYLDECERQGRLMKRLPVPNSGHFVTPAMVHVSGIEDMGKEMFGPILHVATFKANEWAQVVERINTKGYGLTLGVHSRIDGRVDTVCQDAHVGNIYVNRNQIGAVVGSQPFGGHGLSGTGPKAGGCLYLSRFVKGLSDIKMMDSIKADRIARISAVLKPADQVVWAQAIHICQSLNFSTQHLPGPTGELNEYQIIPRGTVLCLGGSEPQDLLLQVLIAGVCGNQVRVIDSASWVFELAQVMDLTLVKDWRVSEVDAVAYFGHDSTAQSLLQKLIVDERVIPLISQPEQVSLWVHEKHVCTDTTAAGGNATLLAQAE